MIDNCEQYMELSITASSLKARIASMIAAANMSNQAIPRPVTEINQYLDNLIEICSHMPQQIENYHKLIKDGRKMIDELHKRLDASIDDFLKSFISDGTDLNQMLKRWLSDSPFTWFFLHRRAPELQYWFCHCSLELALDLQKWTISKA